MKHGKYITIEKNGFTTAVLFHPSLNHNEVVNMAELQRNGAVLRSAGFWVLNQGTVFVDPTLDSATLNIGPLPDDAETIERTLLLTGLKRAAVTVAA